MHGAQVDLSGCFENGQAYVALSRATCLEGLQVLGIPDPSRVKTSQIAKDFQAALDNHELYTDSWWRNTYLPLERQIMQRRTEPGMKGSFSWHEVRTFACVTLAHAAAPVHMCAERASMPNLQHRAVSCGNQYTLEHLAHEEVVNRRRLPTGGQRADGREEVQGASEGAVRWGQLCSRAWGR